MMDRSTIEVALVARTYLYRAFQAVFGGEPTKELLETLFSDVTEQALSCFEGTDYDAYRQTINAFDEAGSTFERDREGFLEAAQRDYTKVLVGPHELKAPPWECVYLTKERVLFQEATLRVRDAYRSENMLPTQYPHVSDDHIAIELDFMAKLCEKSQKALEAEDGSEYRRLLEAQRAFVREHPLVWIESYASDVGEAVPGSLYACVAALLAAFLPIDVEVLGELLDDESCSMI